MAFDHLLCIITTVKYLIKIKKKFGQLLFCVKKDPPSRCRDGGGFAAGQVVAGGVGKRSVQGRPTGLKI